MSTDSKSIKAIMDEKEKDLQSQIQYYKDNMEQLIRIKYMETELDRLKSEIESEYRKRCVKQHQLDIQYERIKYCKENCHKAYETLTYQNNHNEMMNNRHNNKNTISIDVKVNGKLGNGNYRFNYTFNKIDTVFAVTCIINGDTTNQISGTYRTERGFIEN